jgi:hypothetical protein
MFLAAAAFCAAATSAVAAECALSVPDGDATEMLQKAFEDAANTKVTLGAGDYVVAKTLRIRRSNLEIVLKDGARILAKRGMFRGVTESMLQIGPDAENIVLRGEGSATLEMRLKDYQDKSQGYAPGPWRHVVNVHGACNVKISGLTMVRAGGDGLYMNHGARNVTVEDCRFIDNNRLGIAGIDIDGLTVRRCHFEANNGTWPKGGIDLEPNFASQRIKDVLIEDCLFKGHEGCGFVLHVLKLTPKSEPVSVVVRNCRAVDCGQVGYNVTATGEDGPCRGTVLFENCVSVGNRQGDLKEVFMSPDGVQVEVRGCDFKKVEVVPWVKPEDAAPFSAQKVKPLVEEASGGIASTGWLRWGCCFLQPVPGAGRYKVRFDVMKLGKTVEPSLKVVVTDSLGTERDTLDIGPEGADYEFETTGPNCFQFRLSPRACVAKVSSCLPGAAIRADRFVHIFGKDPGRKYRFLVPGDSENVRISVNPEEPMTAALFDGDGREVVRQRFVKVSGTLAASRAKTEKDEIWTLDLTDITEDAQFRIAAPCPPVAELVR